VRARRGDEMRARGPAAGGQARGLAEDGDAVDPRPVERFEQSDPRSVPAVDRRLSGMPQPIGPAPRRLTRRARLEADPRAVWNSDPGALERPRGRRAGAR